MSGPVTGTAPPVTVGLITLPVALAALSAAPSRMIPPVASTVMGFGQEAASAPAEAAGHRGNRVTGCALGKIFFLFNLQLSYSFLYEKHRQEYLMKFFLNFFFFF